MSAPPPGWPSPDAEGGVEETLALLPPDALWPPLPPPDLSRPPPWLLPPPPRGAPPPPPPPGGGAASWESAVPWPPPPAPPSAQGGAHGDRLAAWAPPGGEAAALDGADYGEGDYEQEEEDEYEYGAAEGGFAAGEVVWRAGDALDEDEEEEDDDDAPEVALEMTEEWAARFAQTEHRRAQRKLQERAATSNRQGHAPEPQPNSATPGDAVVGPPLTVVDIVRAAGTGASRPNEELYGVAGAARVAALEAAVQARYTKALAGGKAHLWPCEPLRSA